MADTRRGTRRLRLQKRSLSDKLEVASLKALFCHVPVCFANAVRVATAVCTTISTEFGEICAHLHRKLGRRDVLTVRIVCPRNLNCRISLPYRRRRAGQSRQKLAVHVLDQTEFSSCSSVHLSLWASGTDTTAGTVHGRGPRSPPRARARVVKHPVRNFDVVCSQLFGT